MFEWEEKVWGGRYRHIEILDDDTLSGTDKE